MKDKLLKDTHKNEMDKNGSAALFFAIAFAGVMAFFVLGYLKLSSIDYTTKKGIVVEGRKMSGVSATQEKIQREVQAKLPMQQDEMAPPTSQQIQGEWFLTYGSNSIVKFSVAVDKFEMIIMGGSQGKARSYSRGAIKYDDRSGKLTLYPSKDQGAPKADPGVHYKLLTMRQHDVFVKQKSGDDSLYFLAPSYEIISKSFHPVFLYVDYIGAPVLKFSPVRVGQNKTSQGQ